MAALSAFGTAISALSLVDICFRGSKSVQAAMEFRADYDVYLIRADIVCLHVATLTGLRRNPGFNTPLIQNTLDAMTSEVERIGQLVDSTPSRAVSDLEAQIHASTQTEQYQTALQLHNQLRARTETGSRSPSIASRITWIFYKCEALDNIIRNVTEMIHQVITSLPDDTRRYLDQERSKIVRDMTEPQLRLLDQACDGVDESLGDAARQHRAKDTFGDFELRGSDHFVGEDYRGVTSLPKNMPTAVYGNFKIWGRNQQVGRKHGPSPSK